MRAPSQRSTGLTLVLPDWYRCLLGRRIVFPGGLRYGRLRDHPKNMSRKPRLDDIDSAKGLAIFLVVLGHLSGGEGAN